MLFFFAASDATLVSPLSLYYFRRRYAYYFSLRRRYAIIMPSLLIYRRLPFDADAAFTTLPPITPDADT